MSDDINVTVNETDTIKVTVIETDTISVTITGGIAGASNYTLAFTNSDLASGILTVTHGLNAKYPILEIYNDSDKIVSPDDIEYTDVNSCSIDLTSWRTLTGTWHITVLGGL